MSVRLLVFVVLPGQYFWATAICEEPFSEDTTCGTREEGSTDRDQRSLLQAASISRSRAVVVLQEADVPEQAPSICWIPKEDSDGKVQVAKPRHVSIHAKCPKQCPYSQRLSGDRCFKACVPMGGCRQLHPIRTFEDTQTLTCVPACGGNMSEIVVGCVQCGGPGRCIKCQAMHALSADGARCENTLRGVFTVVYWVLGVVIAFALIYLVHIGLRPTVNTSMLKRAEAHRALCRPMYLDSSGDEPVYRKYSLLTPTHRQDLSGVGVVLYFRWLCFLTFVGLVLFLATLGAFFVAESREQVVGTPGAAERPSLGRLGAGLTTRQQSCPAPWDMGPHDPNSLRVSSVSDLRRVKVQLDQLALDQLSARDWKPKVTIRARANVHGGPPEKIMRPAGDPRDYPRRMFFAMCVAYALITVSTLWFSLQQTNFTRRLDEQTATHQDYVVRAAGLPINSTCPGELRRFFQRVLDEAGPSQALDASKRVVLGVSIAYNYSHKSDEIFEIVDRLQEDLTTAHLAREAEESPRVADFTRSPAAAAGAGKSRECTPNPCFRYVDKQLGPGQSDPTTAVDDQSIRELLQRFEGSGWAYIVVSSEAAARLLTSISCVSYEGKYVYLSEISSEPPTILWANHNPKAGTKQVISALALLVFTIVGWALLYVPYAVFYTSMTRVPGEQVSFWQDIPLSLLIALGNLIVASVIDVVCDQLAFKEKDRRDVYVLGLAFLATLVNTVCDLGMVLIVARGAQLDSAIESGREMGGYDRALARELMGLIVPGYLLLPYLLTPIFEHLLPGYIGRALIRSSRQISPRGAEKALMCPDFDICWRYSDILNNFMICLLLLFLTTPNNYRINLWFVAFIVLMYAIDHYKLLRHTSHTYYSTEFASIAFSYWMSIPTGVIGSIAIWWGIQADMLEEFQAPRILCLLFMLSHVLLYCGILWLLYMCARRPSVTDMTYDEMSHKLHCEGLVYNYFNTNPVHVLRSRLLDISEDDVGQLGTNAIHSPAQGTVPYAIGKEHLQTGVHVYATEENKWIQREVTQGLMGLKRKWHCHMSRAREVTANVNVDGPSGSAF